MLVVCRYGRNRAMAATNPSPPPPPAQCRSSAFVPAVRPDRGMLTTYRLRPTWCRRRHARPPAVLHRCFAVTGALSSEKSTNTVELFRPYDARHTDDLRRVFTEQRLAAIKSKQERAAQELAQRIRVGLLQRGLRTCSRVASSPEPGNCTETEFRCSNAPFVAGWRQIPGCGQAAHWPAW